MKKNNTSQFAVNLEKNFRDLFFTPEIEKRRKEKAIDSNFELLAGQVIFFADGTKPMIRLNNEISANAKLKVVKAENGESIETIEKITLNEKNFENCGHATFVFMEDKMVHCSFDFYRNKAIVKKHLILAKEFYETARFAAEKNMASPFVDNAYSAMELLAKSELLLEPMSGLEKKATHNKIKTEYNRQMKSTRDMHERSKREVFNELSELRKKARYLKGDGNLIFEKDRILNTLEKIIMRIQDIIDY